jgi:ribosomal protein L16 Arg81 hydroxylase
MTMPGIADPLDARSPRASFLELARQTLAALEASPARSGLAGSVGDALFACALNRVDPTIDVDSWLARAIRSTNARRPGPSLHNGVAGLAFVLATYADAEELLCTLDEMLLRSLPTLPPPSLQSGVAGIALYASLRSKAATGQELQRAVVATLASAATVSDDGLVWHTALSYAHDRGVPVAGGPITEFGIVHGIAGTLVALAALAERGHSQAADLARAGLRALWKWERPGTNRFGRIYFGPHGSMGTHDLAGRWCTGDPGVLRACWIAANVVGDKASAQRALEHLRADAQRHADGETAGQPGRFDLCCGSSIIAQVYLRMYRETGQSLFRVANERLLQECAEQVTRMSQNNVRYGSAGVLLALISPQLSEEPIWDSILGISIPRPLPELPPRSGDSSTTPSATRANKNVATLEPTRPSPADFDALLHPFSAERLARDYWERESVFIPGTPEKVHHLQFTLEDYFQACESGPSSLKAQYFDSNGEHTEKHIKGTEARRMYDSGMTICFGNVNVVHSQLAELAKGAKQALGLSGVIEVNSYLSPAGKGFGLHLDDRSVIILQLEGTKRWFYAKTPTLAAPTTNLAARSAGEREFRLAHPWFTNEFPTDEQLQEQLLSPGDVLYLPAGTAHRTEAGPHSLALTISCQARKFPELIIGMMTAALEPSVIWRARLPALAGSPAQLRNAFMRRIASERLAQLRAWTASLDEEQIVREWQQQL